METLSTTTQRRRREFVKAPSKDLTPSLFKRLEAEGEEFQLNTDTYKKGQHLFREGNMPIRLFCIKSGRVKVYKAGDDGKEQILFIAREGDFLGYADLMARSNHSTAAEVLDDAELYTLARDDFYRLMASNMHFSNEFTRLVLRDVMTSQKKIVDLAYKPVRSRLAEILLSFTKEGQENGTQINLTRDDIARLVGTAKETAIRLLSEFKKAGYVSIQGRVVIITNSSALKKIDQMLL